MSPIWYPARDRHIVSQVPLLLFILSSFPYPVFFEPGGHDEVHPFGSRYLRHCRMNPPNGRRRTITGPRRRPFNDLEAQTAGKGSLHRENQKLPSNFLIFYWGGTSNQESSWTATGGKWSGKVRRSTL